MYRELAPPPQLADFIDAYWVSATDSRHKRSVNRILPDTCTDIIINLGSDIYSHGSEDAQLKEGNCYLLGTATKYTDVIQEADSLAYGIRFKPFALQLLLGIPLLGMADKKIELGRNDFDFMRFILHGSKLDVRALNALFMGRLPQTSFLFFNILKSIQSAKGAINITDLASKHHITERQLERIFSEKAGVAVKELCNQYRMKNAIQVIKNKTKDQSLLSISLETGFYDHAHLANNLKKYTGYTPSDFLK